MATAPADSSAHHVDHRFLRARRAMIDSQLRPSGISEDYVLDPMSRLPRELYVPTQAREAAYIDRRLPLSGDRAMSPPLAQARLLKEARPRATDRALLIGGGTGYLAALLGPQVALLDVVEPETSLSGLNPTPEAARWHQGPLQHGWSDGAPYDLIVIDGAVEELSPALASQLKNDGRLVTGSVTEGVTRIAVGRRAGDTIALQPLTEMGIPVLSAFNRLKGWSF
jgi:protein-L-isoaspartate(D-aspartate) O-methyltransferase